MPRTKNATIGVDGLDRSWFTSSANMTWYRENKGSTMVIERTFDPQLDRDLGLRAALDRLGWGRLADLSGEYYPDLVRIFYANISGKKDGYEGRIVSRVRGIQLEFTEEWIAQTLGVPNVGPLFHIHELRAVNDPAFDFEVAADHFTRGRLQEIRRGRQSARHDGFIPIHFLTPQERVLVAFFQSNVMPRSGSAGEVRMVDVYWLAKIFDGLGNVTGIPVASTIVECIRGVFQRSGRALVFPVLISRLLVAAGVSTFGTEIAHTDEGHVFRRYFLHRNHFVQRDGVWINPKLDTPPVPQPAEPEPLEHPVAEDTSLSQSEQVVLEQRPPEQIVALLQRVLRRQSRHDRALRRLTHHFGLDPPSPPSP